MSELAGILGSLRPVLRMRTIRGEPIAAGEHEITPVARSVVLGIAGAGGRFAAAWARTRPVAVLDTWRGETRRIPIPDPTRRIMLAMTAAVLLVALVARYAASKK